LTTQPTDSTKSPNETDSISVDTRTIGTLSRLWVAGIAAYGARWARFLGQLPVDDTGALTVAGMMWAQRLAPFSRKTVLDALDRHVDLGKAWPPVLPEMRMLCLGIPNIGQIRAELTRPGAEWSQAARAVASYLDWHSYRTASVDAGERMLSAAYDAVTEMICLGRALPDAPAVLTQERRDPGPRTPEVATAAMSKIKTMLHPDEGESPDA
jgi:hypothetical protein